MRISHEKVKQLRERLIRTRNQLAKFSVNPELEALSADLKFQEKALNKMIIELSLLQTLSGWVNKYGIMNVVEKLLAFFIKNTNFQNHLRVKNSLSVKTFINLYPSFQESARNLYEFDKKEFIKEEFENVSDLQVTLANHKWPKVAKTLGNLFTEYELRKGKINYYSFLQNYLLAFRKLKI